VRALRIGREALLYLLISGLSLVALLTCAREVLRPPAGGAGLWGGNVPFTEHKWPWVLVFAALLALLWLVFRIIGGARGPIWGALVAGLLTVFWWSAAALLLFLGVAIHGFATHPMAYLNWPFALGYLLITLIVLVLCAWLQRRLRRSPD
jgi:hypothetical protein